MRARMHLAGAQPTAIHPTSAHAAGAVAVAVLAAAVFIFLAVMARVTRHLAALLSDLLQVAVAVTSALFAIAIIAGVVAVLLFHG
jgi:hypothetical protein